MSGKLTRDQKRRLAGALLYQAGTLIEFWGTQKYDRDVADIDREAAAQQIAQWLKDLPGDAWDNMLPSPIRGSAR